jgi:prepilin-type N-terminal cleavage/methylation domain-containing protein
MSTRESGFTLIEVVVVSAVAMITLGLAAPALTGAMQHYQFNTDVQQLATTIRNARYKAVASNATMRVRLNCPSQGQMRVVQLTGNAAIDNAGNRCDTAVYPYPGTTTATAGDGPVVLMGTSINYPQSVASIQISNTGRMVPLTACPNCTTGAPPFTVSVQDDRNSLQRNITVSATGSLTIEDFAHALGN